MNVLAVVAVVLLVLPLQALTAVYLDLVGPAHFHVGHHHGHDHVERHHHHHGDPSVVAAGDQDLLEQLALKEETAPGWSSTMVAAVAPDRVSLALADTSQVPVPRLELRLQTRFPGRLERPPRPLAP